MKVKKNRSNDVWYVKIRGSYLPASPMGIFVHTIFVAYLAVSAIISVQQTDNSALALLIIFPNWVAAAAVITYIASQKS